MVDNKLKSSTKLTCAYRVISGHEVELDLYLPSQEFDAGEPGESLRTTFVYFHGGGLTVGEKTSWFPSWVYDRAMTAGFAFISVNYQLIPPATGHQIVEDIHHLFAFLENDVNKVMQAHGRNDRIDVGRIAVIGTSAGGLCAYLAGIHARPKPKAVLSIYGMGGDYFTPQYLEPKTTPFFRGRELLDPATFSEFLFPNSNNLSPTSSSLLSYYGPDHVVPGYPRNPRMLLVRLYMQMGNFLDYYTGQHQPSISEIVRDLLHKENRNEAVESSSIPLPHHSIFPQLNPSAFPATFFIHGSEDTAVPVQESRSLHRRLQSSGIVTILKVCNGMEHSFDYEPDSERRWVAVFDEAFNFLKYHLSGEQ